MSLTSLLIDGSLTCQGCLVDEFSGASTHHARRNGSAAASPFAMGAYRRYCERGNYLAIPYLFSPSFGFELRSDDFADRNMPLGPFRIIERNSPSRRQSSCGCLSQFGRRPLQGTIAVVGSRMLLLNDNRLLVTLPIINGDERPTEEVGDIKDGVAFQFWRKLLTLAHRALSNAARGFGGQELTLEGRQALQDFDIVAQRREVLLHNGTLENLVCERQISTLQLRSRLIRKEEIHSELSRLGEKRCEGTADDFLKFVDKDANCSRLHSSFGSLNAGVERCVKPEPGYESCGNRFGQGRTEEVYDFALFERAGEIDFLLRIANAAELSVFEQEIERHPHLVRITEFTPIGRIFQITSHILKRRIPAFLHEFSCHAKKRRQVLLRKVRSAVQKPVIHVECRDQHLRDANDICLASRHGLKRRKEERIEIGIERQKSEHSSLTLCFFADVPKEIGVAGEIDHENRIATRFSGIVITSKKLTDKRDQRQRSFATPGHSTHVHVSELLSTNEEPLS